MNSHVPTRVDRFRPGECLIEHNRQSRTPSTAAASFEAFELHRGEGVFGCPTFEHLQSRPAARLYLDAAGFDVCTCMYARVSPNCDT
jgi:hypothetical protein